MLRLEVGYPALEDEIEILQRYDRVDPLDDLRPVVGVADVLALQRAVRAIHVADPVRRYIVEIVRATRANEDIQLGASPRGSLALHRGAQALAALRGRDFAKPDDIKELVAPILGHRLILAPEARLRGRAPATVIGNILARVPAPVE
jgi:MoxR-like ATPase